MNKLICLLCFMTFTSVSFAAPQKVFCDYEMNQETKQIQVQECTDAQLVQIYKEVKAAQVKENSRLEKLRNAGYFMIKVGGVWFATSFAVGALNLLTQDDALINFMTKSRLLGTATIAVGYGGITVAPAIFVVGVFVSGLAGFVSHIGEAHAATMDNYYADPQNLGQLLELNEKAFVYYAKLNPQVNANVLVVHKTLNGLKNP